MPNAAVVQHLPDQTTHPVPPGDLCCPLISWLTSDFSASVLALLWTFMKKKHLKPPSLPHTGASKEGPI